MQYGLLFIDASFKYTIIHRGAPYAPTYIPSYTPSSILPPILPYPVRTIFIFSIFIYFFYFFLRSSCLRRGKTEASADVYDGIFLNNLPIGV